KYCRAVVYFPAGLGRTELPHRLVVHRVVAEVVPTLQYADRHLGVGDQPGADGEDAHLGPGVFDEVEQPGGERRITVAVEGQRDLRPGPRTVPDLDGLGRRRRLRRLRGGLRRSRAGRWCGRGRWWSGRFLVAGAA